MDVCISISMCLSLECLKGFCVCLCLSAFVYPVCAHICSVFLPKVLLQYVNIHMHTKAVSMFEEQHRRRSHYNPESTDAITLCLQWIGIVSKCCCFWVMIFLTGIWYEGTLAKNFYSFISISSLTVADHFLHFLPFSSKGEMDKLLSLLSIWNNETICLGAA